MRFIDPDGMVAEDYLAYLDKGNGNEREKSEAKSVEECERCAELPEVVVTAERLDGNSSNGIRINGYWGGCGSGSEVLNAMGRPMSRGAANPVYPEVIAFPVPPLFQLTKYVRSAYQARFSGGIAANTGRKLTVQFGKGPNQVSHAFRHTDALG